MAARAASAMARRPFSAGVVKGARKCTSACSGGSPSRRRKLPRKPSPCRNVAPFQTPAAAAIRQRHGLYRYLRIQRALEHARMEGAHRGDAGQLVLDAAFGEHRHGPPAAQPLHHHRHHRTQRAGVAATMKNGAGARRQPAHQRPARDLGLGHEARRALRMQQLNVHPRYVIGHEQHRPVDLRAVTDDAKTECAAQHPARPAAHDALRQRLAACRHLHHAGSSATAPPSGMAITTSVSRIGTRQT